MITILHLVTSVSLFLTFLAYVPTTVRIGDLFVIRIPEGQPAPTVIEFLGTRYPALYLSGEKSPVFLLGVDLEAAAEEIPLVFQYPDRVPDLQKHSITVRSRKFPIERLTLPQAMVTPPPEVHDRIAAERRKAAEIYRSSSTERLWLPPFARSSDGVPSGNFGRRRVLNGVPRSPHSGEDYAASRGSEVRAAARGRVRLAEDFYYSGLTVLIDHGVGLVSQYFHLGQIHVSEGDLVESGQIVGRVGSTGRATGPHLHFGLRLFGQRVDPETLWDLFPQ